MITFNYRINHNLIVLKISNWCGLESVFLNGKLVSRKFNFGAFSIHNVALRNGKLCKLQLFIDAKSNLLTCRVYNQEKLMITLKEGKKHLLESKRYLEIGSLLCSLSLIGILYLM
ncbi:hypothetical protein ACFOD0_02280 [Shewanella intestini]|uniref:Uncharacterized protein n=1 Tax=Shewanella intestini TaxID=2017544 RepID=A0ABS5I1B6_9GAMM|nr:MULTISPECIES: hypothetical protein [Shewanella]MBR9727816.1 hypothetical protein [Shewanella intestini]MRG36191.1 hypothetical protein [Shewanella sp. XMDDZSB0408]